jgi:taurine--2-oxoglutarate transaminase
MSAHNTAALSSLASGRLESAANIRELGMFTFVKWNYIFIAPPLTVTKAQVDEGLDIISQAISIADGECY